MSFHTRKLGHVLLKCLNVVGNIFNRLRALCTADELKNFFIFDLGH
jgi:hypothetical protein